MSAIRKTRNVETSDDSVFADADVVIELAQKSFDTAAKIEVSQNDALGIATHEVGGMGDK